MKPYPNEKVVYEAPGTMVFEVRMEGTLLQASRTDPVYGGLDEV